MGTERLTVDGIGVAYELLGPAGTPAVVLTPGGRFSMETPGLRELAERLAAGGRRVLLWDRPNCGLSDIVFAGDSESAVQSRALIGLLRALDLGPAVLAGGSAGARLSLITAAAAPELVSHLVLWWISGGALGATGLAYVYCGAPAFEATIGGMAAVADMPGWAEQVRRNPEARAAILGQDLDAFLATMQRWAAALIPAPGLPAPGLTREQFAALAVPTLILRNGARDMHHTRETTQAVHDLLPNSTLADPPWGDDEWNQNRKAVLDGTSPGHFVNWPRLAPTILAFTGLAFTGGDGGGGA